MLEGMQRLLPTAEVGFLGHDPRRSRPGASTYARAAAETIAGRQCYLLDPECWRPAAPSPLLSPSLAERCRHITAICLSPHQGRQRLEAGPPATCGCRSTLVTAGLDERLNDKGYIVPGLGDAGDRLYGVTD
jgi:uracil phosphoribosyltransferase